MILLRKVGRAQALKIALVGWLALAGPGTAFDLVPLPEHPPNLPWPTAVWPRGALPEDLDRAVFDRHVEALFAPKGRGGFRDTRALLLVRGGRLVFERYAEGFGPDSVFQSWSMAKSVTSAFVGVLVRQGLLDVEARAAVSEWGGADDPRRAITLSHLLQMRSGLANDDGFGGGGDLVDGFISRLMFGEGSRAPAAYAIDVPMVAPVGTRWAYSTGTSMIVAALAGRIVGGGAVGTRDFLRRELFDRLGMTSAQPEFAASGGFLGGGFVHASARDWARFGYLYLRDGVWDGERILPEGWVDYTRTPNPAENNGVYGAHFWVNVTPAEGQWEVVPGAPESTFAAEGAFFQMVAIAPTMDLVAVRLGETQDSPFPAVKADFGALVGAFPEVHVR